MSRLVPENLKARTEAAKKKIALEVENKKKLKYKEQCEKKNTERLWKMQERKIIDAALEGFCRVELDLPVIKYKKLVENGIQVVEKGFLLKSQVDLEMNRDLLNEISFAKQDVLNEFDEFIDAAKSNLKRFYGGIRAFHEANYIALNDAMQEDCIWGNCFAGDELYRTEIPTEITKKYDSYLIVINEKIRIFKGLINESENESNRQKSLSSRQSDRNAIMSDYQREYAFNVNDEDVELLFPVCDGNIISASWSNDSWPMCLTDPLLSENGLAWLSSHRGENLLQNIKSFIGLNSDQGRNNCTLEFSLKDNGWYLIINDRNIPSCLPGDIVNLIYQEELKVGIKSGSSSAYISVEW